jgi:hypothetical protein
MKKLNQSGAVAMLSVVIFTLVVTVIVFSYLALAINQQSEAQNFDFSTRAYYSAESGAQDAVRAIARDSSLQSTGRPSACTPALGGTGSLGDSTKDYGLNYTCQLVNPTPSSITGTVGQSRNALIPLRPSASGSGYSLYIWWSKIVQNGSDQLLCPGTTNKLLPTYSSWNNQVDNQFTTAASCNGATAAAVHPMIRASVITYPTAATGRASINQQVVFLNPAETADTAPALSPTDDISKTNQSAVITNARCVNNMATSPFGNRYACQGVLNISGYNFSNNQVYLRLHSIYRDNVGFAVGLQKAGANSPLDQTQVLVDVTGKSNNVFRRIQQTFSLKNGISYDNLPEAAVIGGDGICKLYTVSTDPATYDGGPENCSTN